MEKKPSILLGLAGSLIGGAVGGVAYYILLQVNYFASITGIIGVIISCTLFMKLGNRPNVGLIGCLGSIVFNILGVGLATYFDLLKETVNYFGVTTSEAKLILYENYHILLSDLDFLKGIFLATVIILVFSIRYAWSTRGAHKAPKTFNPVPVINVQQKEDHAVLTHAVENETEATAEKENENIPADRAVTNNEVSWEDTPPVKKSDVVKIEADLEDLETDFVD